jgi:hypothetical protein
MLLYVADIQWHRNPPRYRFGTVTHNVLDSMKMVVCGWNIPRNVRNKKVINCAGWTCVWVRFPVINFLLDNIGTPCVLMCTVHVTGSEALAVSEGSGEAEEPGVPVVAAFSPAGCISVTSSTAARCVPSHDCLH